MKKVWLSWMSIIVVIITLLPVTVRTEEPAAAHDVHMIVPTGEASSYWTRWRGPSGQGWITGENYPDTWSGIQNVRWKVPVSGEGNSSPIIWDDTIFLTTAYDKGKGRSVLAFQRSDGRLLWECFMPDTEPERAHVKNGHASGTPATDGRHIYAYFGSHGLAAVDMKGTLAWHVDLGAINTLHGTACSPLLYNGL